MSETQTTIPGDTKTQDPAGADQAGAAGESGAAGPPPPEPAKSKTRKLRKGDKVHCRYHVNGGLEGESTATVIGGESGELLTLRVELPGGHPMVLASVPKGGTSCPRWRPLDGE